MFSVLGQLLVNGILIGSIYACMAIGFSLIWGVIGVINVAQGELLMLGAFGTYWLFTLFAISPFLTIPIVIIAMFLVGYLIQHTIINRVVKHSLFITLLLTFGLSVFIRQMGLRLWSANMRYIPVSFATASYEMLGLNLPAAKLITFPIALLLTGICWFFLKYTRTGQAIRATAQNQRAASLAGVKIKHIYAITFGLSAAIVGAAGSLVSLIWPIYPHMGIPFTVRSFVIVILGGLGSIPGALLGGFIIASAESFGGYFLGTEWKLCISLALLVITLIVRPKGLFGRAEE